MNQLVPDGSPMKKSFVEEKQNKFNYEAHWVIEENLRERISELKRDLAEKKSLIDTVTAERDMMETQLIKVKAEWANSELERAQMHLSPSKSDSDDE